VSDTVITQRALNRATLARQLLLERSPMGIADALEHLVGLQAQTANTWYTGLWSRLEGFDPCALSRLIEQREAVRVALMRSTIHLVTTRDALALRPLVQPAVERPMTGPARRELKTTHAPAIAALGRELLSERPLTNIELGKLLAARWPDADPSDLVMAVRVTVPLAQVPPRGLWGQSGAARHAPLEAWVGRPLGPAMQAEDLVRRYLSAFGPATPADAQAWSGLSRLREVFERLRPELVTFRDENGRELFDMPDAPRPDPETPSPVRFLYDYDNLMLGHADRSRFIPHELRARVLTSIGNYSYGSLLVDGFGRGIWRIERDKDAATLIVRLLGRITASEKTRIAEEGHALLEFWAAEASSRKLSFDEL